MPNRLRTSNSLLVVKASLAWFLIMLLAIANGIAREALLEPALGPAIALPLSGILLALIILLASWLLVPWFGRARASAWIAIGLLWVVLTLLFEYLFGHFVAGMPWAEISRVFDVTSGNLFSLALLSAALSPWLAARLRGLVD
jgi:hypothetical protein